MQGLDPKVQPNEVMALVGSSGSGKTTLMNVLGGLDRPSAGRVIVAGNDLLKLSIEVRRGSDAGEVSRRIALQVKERFELTPQVVLLETGTLAREFEANVKAARFLDRRG